MRVLDNGVMRTVIGTGELGDSPAGPALEVGLNHPTHISFDPLGRLILSAWHNSKVMRVDFTTGQIEPVVGDGTRFFRGDGGPAIDATRGDRQVNWSGQSPFPRRGSCHTAVHG